MFGHSKKGAEVAAGWREVETALPHRVTVRLGEREGRVIATGILIEAEGELTTRDLRLPLAQYVSELAAIASAGTPSRPGRRGHTDKHYRSVAKAYRRAQRQHPRAPIRQLMEEFRTSEPTAHRWLREARKRGLLT